VRRRYVIALIVALILAFWATGRMDPALAKWGLNKNTCYQVMGSTYCGDAADKIESARMYGQQP
jgi:hypothetical protein